MAAIQRTLEEALPVAERGAVAAVGARRRGHGAVRYSLADTRKFAGTCLMRRLKVIGLQ